MSNEIARIRMREQAGHALSAMDRLHLANDTPSPEMIERVAARTARKLRNTMPISDMDLAFGLRPRAEIEKMSPKMKMLWSDLQNTAAVQDARDAPRIQLEEAIAAVDRRFRDAIEKGNIPVEFDARKKLKSLREQLAALNETNSV